MEMRKPFQSCEWKKCRGETKDGPWHGISLRKLNILHCQKWYSLSMPLFFGGGVSIVMPNPLTDTMGRRWWRTGTWTSPDVQYWNQIDYILCSQRWRSSIQSTKTRLGAECGSDHELLIAKFRLKLKKVGKTTRPFRYDLNQIPYDYAVEVRNRFKGLDLIECLMNYGMRFVTLYRRQGSRPSPRKRNAKKQNSCLRRPYK